MDWQRRGKAHVLGHDFPHDGGVMAFDIVLARITDPAELIPHLFAEVDPTLAGRLERGDVIVAGRNFLAGKAHNAGLIALKAMGISLVCESMSVRALQGVVALALPALVNCTGVTQEVQDGDVIDVDFLAGTVINNRNGRRLSYPGLPPEVRSIIENGGMKGMLTAHLAAHPELG